MKIGLVLSGGGGKGAYELGVWKALKELNLNKYISVFSGTSIGAFNAALFAMDDLEKKEKSYADELLKKSKPSTTVTKKRTKPKINFNKTQSYYTFMHNRDNSSYKYVY